MAFRVVLISLSLLEKVPFDNDPLKNHSIETEEEMKSSLDTCTRVWRTELSIRCREAVYTFDILLKNSIFELQA